MRPRWPSSASRPWTRSAAGSPSRWPRSWACGSTRATAPGTRCSCPCCRPASSPASCCPRSFPETAFPETELRVMARTLVVLSGRLGAVLPAAALPALRGAEHVLADVSVPAEVAEAAGAAPVPDPTPGSVGWPADSCVLLTTDPAHPLLASADAVLTVPEPPGAALLDAVAVMDRLRSPGGCPWDAEQTHLSLLQYLVEECYELYQAVEDADRPALREELGDVLLQVLFHARVAAEGGVKPYPPEAPAFGIDEVAADLVRKLVDRHPHVFAAEVAPADQVRTASDQEVRWDELKRAEKRRE